MLHAQHLVIDTAIGWAGGSIPRRRFPRPSSILAAFIEMDELLMADKKITDVHISIFLRKLLSYKDAGRIRGIENEWLEEGETSSKLWMSGFV